MARKKIEPIESLGKDTTKLTVQKSLPLFALWRSDLTLAEFKILDTYLARINSHSPEKRRVVFSKGELEEKLGVTKINKPDLEKRLIHLMGNVVKVPDSNTKRGFKLVTLFEEVYADQDDNGLWTITLECTQKAMKYFFNVDNLGYLRYKLRCITSMTSRYTYIMFIYLESNRFRKSWRKDCKTCPMQFRSLLNGVLMQEKDLSIQGKADLEPMTDKQPTASEVEDLLFANKIVKNSKSNAITLVKNKQLCASGIGQTSRVDSLRQAIEKAKSFGFDLNGAVMASDAFFPFPDCVEIADQAGITAVIQPGGSINDKLSVEYCNQHGLAMVKTGVRHFKH